MKDNNMQKFNNKNTDKEMGQKININFSDVAGLDEIKEELLEISDFLLNPRKYERFGAKIPSGVLLYGPPGTGKTLIAKALAGQSDANFIYASGSEFIEKFVGIGASRIRNLFERAKKKTPCIIFIDELDAIGVSRNTDNNSERDQTLNQFLIELDGFSDKKGVVVMAATNRIDMLDKALLRPGRFDRHIYVGTPSYETRKQIFIHHIKNKPIQKNLDIDTIIKKTSGLSGAHIANIANEAALLAIRRKRRIISQEDFEEAVIKNMAGLKNKNSRLSLKERKIVAYHESGHTIASFIINGALPSKVTIIPHSKALGFVLKEGEEDKLILTKSELENKICILLAGRACEEVVFGQITTGASNDILEANNLAYAMVCEYGMSKYENKTFNERDEKIFKEVIDEEVNKILKKAYENSKDVIKDNLETVHMFADILNKREELDSKDLEKIFDRAFV